MAILQIFGVLEMHWRLLDSSIRLKTLIHHWQALLLDACLAHIANRCLSSRISPSWPRKFLKWDSWVGTKVSSIKKAAEPRVLGWLTWDVFPSDLSSRDFSYELQLLLS